MSIWSFVNFPAVICSPTVCYFSREKPLLKLTAQGSLSHIFAFAVYFSFAFIFRSTKYKYKNTLLQFILIYFIWRLIYQFTTISSRLFCLSWGAVPRKELTTPLTRRVARSCYLCAGAVNVVLLGSPTGLTTLVSHLREIPTAAVLHHPFLFGETPM